VLGEHGEVSTEIDVAAALRLNEDAERRIRDEDTPMGWPTWRRP
jgi:hypothetical protein